MPLTIEEKIEIIHLSRKRSFQQTAEEFNRLHPNRLQRITKQTVGRIFSYLRSNGNLYRKKRSSSIQRTVEQAELKDKVVQLFNNDPNLSTRKAAVRLGVGHVHVWNILKDLKFKPYKMSKHQKLQTEDPPKRKEFCELLLETIEMNPEFLKTILWTDEKIFELNGCFNRQNFR